MGFQRLGVLRGRRGGRNILDAETRRNNPVRPQKHLDFIFAGEPSSLRLTLGIAVAAGSTVPGLGLRTHNLGI